MRSSRLRRPRRRRLRSPLPALLRPTGTAPPTVTSPTPRSRRSPRRLRRLPLRTRRRRRLPPHKYRSLPDYPGMTDKQRDGEGRGGEGSKPSLFDHVLPLGLAKSIFLVAPFSFFFLLLLSLGSFLEVQSLVSLLVNQNKTQGDLHNGPWAHLIFKAKNPGAFLFLFLAPEKDQRAPVYVVLNRHVPSNECPSSETFHSFFCSSEHGHLLISPACRVGAMERAMGTYIHTYIHTRVTM